MLVPTGRVALSTWDVPERSPFFAAILGAVADAEVPPPTEIPPGPSFFQFADEAVFAALLADAGFRDVSVGETVFDVTLRSADELIVALAEGTVRTGSLLRAAGDAQQRSLRESLVGQARAVAARGAVRRPRLGHDRERKEDLVSAIHIDRDRLVDWASRAIGTPSFTGSEEAMAELVAETFAGMGLRVQWQQVEDGRANVLGVRAGAGGGTSLMFNGHMDTSSSGREPWLQGIPGLQPQGFEQDGRIYGLGISNMKGALACYVEAARALAAAGAHLRGDLLIAAVSGEIEKTQQGDAQGAEYRGYATGTSYLVRHGGVADVCILGEPTEGQVVLGHFGSLWVRISTQGPYIHTAFSEGRRSENSILRMREVLDAVLEWIPGWESGHTYAGANAIVNVGALQGGFGWRVSRTPHRTDLFLDVRVPPTMPMARARSEVMEFRALAAGAFPGSRRRGRGLRDGAGSRDRRGASADRRDRRGARPRVRRGARARHDALVLGRLRADALRRADGQLRNVERPARSAARREPRHRRTGEDGHGLRTDGRPHLRGGRMKLVTYELDGVRIPGVLEGGSVQALACADIRSYYEGGMQADRIGKPIALDLVRLCAPIAPKKFLHTAGNFREHADESKQVGWTHEIAPWIGFYQNVDAIIGPDEPVIYPEHLTEELDYELELCIVMASRASTSGPRRRRTTSAAT